MNGALGAIGIWVLVVGALILLLSIIHFFMHRPAEETAAGGLFVVIIGLVLLFAEWAI